MEYKCDICGKPATVHITKIIDGQKVKIHLCSECAEKASLDSMALPANIFPKIKELEEEVLATKVGEDACPSCGASLAEIEKGARFSCPECYCALGKRLFTMLAQMHGSAKHAGKTPKHHTPNAVCKKSRKKHFATAKLKLQKENKAPVKVAVSAVAKTETKEALGKLLQTAIEEERYEDAAKLRDKLKLISE